MFWFLSTILSILGLVVTAVGAVTIFYWIKPAEGGVDPSNVINRIRLWWFACKRPYLFIDVFPWLKNDELDNVTKK